MNQRTTTSNQRGATAVEYALLLATVALAAIGLLRLYGGHLVDVIGWAVATAVEQPPDDQRGPERRDPQTPPPTGRPPADSPAPRLVDTGLTPTFRLGTWPGAHRTPVYPIELAPGPNQLTWLAWDSYPGRADQPFEQADVFVVYDNGDTEQVTTTPDIGPGEHVEEMFTVEFDAAREVVGMYATTTDQALDDGGPNSVNLNLLAIDGHNT